MNSSNSWRVSNMSSCPKLRIEGFTDAWEQRKLGEYIIEYKEVTTQNDQYPPLTSSRRGIFLQTEYFDGNQIASKDNVGYNIVPYGYFTYRHMSDDDIFHFNINTIVENGIVSTLYPVFTTNNELDSKYLQYQLNYGHEFAKYAIMQKQGGSRTYMYLNKLKQLYITMPLSVDEQKKISFFFSKLDDLITLHQRKSDALKNAKKYFLKNIFPSEGEKFPKLRLEGFTDAWEQRKLLDLLIQPITDGPHETPKLVEKGVPFISVDAIIDNKIDFSRKRGDITEEYNLECCKKYKPQLYDVYLVKSGSTVGKVAIVESSERFNIWSPLAAMRCGNKSAPYFLYFLLQTKGVQSQVLDKASNGTQPNLSMRELEKFPVIIPSSIDEQKCIGSYFLCLDNLITLHQRKCDVLKNAKKFFLQNMFV